MFIFFFLLTNWKGQLLLGYPVHGTYFLLTNAMDKTGKYLCGDKWFTMQVCWAERHYSDIVPQLINPL